MGGYIIRDLQSVQNVDRDCFPRENEVELRLVPLPETDVGDLIRLASDRRNVEIREAYPPAIIASDEPGRERLVHGLKLALALVNEFADALEKSGCDVDIRTTPRFGTTRFEAEVTRRYR